MKTTYETATSATLFFCLLLINTILPSGIQGAEYEENMVIRFYGDLKEDSPMWELVQDDEGYTMLHAKVLDPQSGAGPALIFSSSQILTETGNQRELSGRSTFDGTPITWEARIEENASAITWLEPASIPLRNGKLLPLAGRFEEVSDESRLEQARAAFQGKDEKLNQLYREFKTELTVSLFEELKINQRAWLKYRDYITYDSDNSGVVGPGTVRHTWRQAERTQDRINFLRAFSESSHGTPDLSAAYSDGTGFRLHFCEVKEDVVLFHLESVWTWHLPKEFGFGNTLYLMGKASSVENGLWRAKPEDCQIFSFSNEPLPAHIDFRLLERNRIEVSAANRSAEGKEILPVFNTSYYRQDQLTPDIEPLAAILTRLPEACFEEMTEPLTQAGTTVLALTGEWMLDGEGAEHYRKHSIEKRSRDFLQIKIPFGEWKMRRHPRRDGSALLLISTQNGQSSPLSCWDLLTDGSIHRLNRDSVFPEIEAADFFEDPEDAKLAVSRFGEPSSSSVFSIESDFEVEVFYPRANEDLEPTHIVTFPWFEHGFGLSRDPAQP